AHRARRVHHRGRAMEDVAVIDEQRSHEGVEVDGADTGEGVAVQDCVDVVGGDAAGGGDLALRVALLQTQIQSLTQTGDVDVRHDRPPWRSVAAAWGGPGSPHKPLRLYSSNTTLRGCTTSPAV